MGGGRGALLTACTVACAALMVSGLAQGPAAAADLDCADFRYQEDAQRVLDSTPGDPHRLDGDHDGIACERLPRRSGSASRATPSAAVRDWSGDGRNDVLAVTGNGAMMLYRGTTSGRLAAGQQIGQGWSAVDTVTQPCDWDSDGRADVMVRRGSDLVLYRGNGRGGFRPTAASAAAGARSPTSWPPATGTATAAATSSRCATTAACTFTRAPGGVACCPGDGSAPDGAAWTR